MCINVSEILKVGNPNTGVEQTNIWTKGFMFS